MGAMSGMGAMGGGMGNMGGQQFDQQFATAQAQALMQAGGEGPDAKRTRTDMSGNSVPGMGNNDAMAAYNKMMGA